MLENIINNVKGQLTGELQNKFNLQPDTANKSVDLAKDNLANGLKNQASSGDFGGIMDILKGNKGATEHAGVNSIIGNYVHDLTTKLGVPESVAKQVGPYVITFLMQKLTGKVNSEGMGQSDIMGMLGGGLGGGLKDKLPKGLGDKLGGLF
ncbi:hypothetical protein [Pontibacter harenae]|uniref:hypothetical protein n=1 Tax=Pontibacter harenae TaxID=2894083 RepID=UPI001E5D16B2|nr:hypothetical protein [Pontibacter harenae]MCC9166713.1 hypothetical protein [Pontibacter harenae]